MEVRDIRERSGLSQAELARRAGVAPSNLAAMEAGTRRPSPVMLERLIEAAGLQRPSVVVKKRRDDILAVIRDAGGTMPRVFGSCARGDDTALSDLDLFITPTQGNAWKFVGIASRLSELLGIKVDVIDGRTTNPRLAQAQQEAVAL